MYVDFRYTFDDTVRGFTKILISNTDKVIVLGRLLESITVLSGQVTKGIDG